MTEPILIYDTTLRDGTQGENINFSAEEKLKIARKLDELGVHYIEGGWPGSNPRDIQFFKLAQRTDFKQARITAFGATRRPGIAAADDGNLQALLKSHTPVVAIFGKTWDLHVETVMGNTLEENLAMISDSVAFLNDEVDEVIYDAEHFFDAYKENPDYALKTLIAAADAKADALVLCDTNGGTLPFETETIITEVQTALAAHYKTDPAALPFLLGIHSHDDCGLAVANSITAVRKGVRMVHGTINGYGERCGNADLTAIIPILRTKMNRDCIRTERLKKLRKLSRFVSETANIVPRNTRPFVGKSAFAHKGGIHVSAIMKEARAYEHLDPEVVGNRRRVLISDLSGRSNIEYKAKELGVELGANGYDSRKIVTRIKELEQMGYQFEVADGSFKVLIKKLTDQFKVPFLLESFRVSTEKDKNKPCRSHATIKISVGDTHEITAAEGDGPVSALDNALRKALSKFFPDLEAMRLVDFKVRVIDGRHGTSSKVRVFIESRDHDHLWSTIGVSEDIIEASWQALEDSFQYKLTQASEDRNNACKC